MADRFPLAERHHPLAPEFRRCCVSAARSEGRRAAVLLSGGVDSQAVLRGLLEAGERPEVLSFRTAETLSTDFRVASETAEALGLPFHEVWIPTEAHILRSYVRDAVERLGLRKKADVECFYPRWMALGLAADLKVEVLYTGDGGDGYFGVSKRAILHYSQTPDLMDEWRSLYFGKRNWSQTETIRAEAERLGLSVIMPLADRSLIRVCGGWGWEALNRPKQKQPIRDAFDLPPLPPHVNLQLGDSGIAEAFKQLTPEGKKSPVAYYNQVARDVEAESAGQASLL